MKWEGLNLHVENLVPGVTTLVLVAALVPKTVIDSADALAASTLLNNTFSAGGVLVAASYLVGTFTVAICRCIIDPISAKGPRPRLLRMAYPKRFKDMKTPTINQEYRKATQAALRSDSEYKRAEVKNRRERGRLLRSGILPMALLLWWVTDALPVLARILIQVVGIAIGIFLYAYTELTIFQESVLGDPE